jgi:hypothetical protein
VQIQHIERECALECFVKVPQPCCAHEERAWVLAKRIEPCVVSKIGRNIRKNLADV